MTSALTRHAARIASKGCFYEGKTAERASWRGATIQFRVDGKSWHRRVFSVSMSSCDVVYRATVFFFQGAGGGRSFSSKASSSNRDVHALAYSVSPQQAADKFHRWADAEQGLTWLLRPRNVRIAAAYCPVWSFDVNVRYVLAPKSSGGRRTVVGWKPSALEAAFGKQASVVLLPGISAYAGYSYRRSLVNPVHSTSLLFLGDKTVPFGAWMLRDMDYYDHRGRLAKLPVHGDAWNTTKGRAFSIVRGDLEALARLEAPDDATLHVQTQVVASRRVYMPTYVLTYQVLGVEYQAFVSGCDNGASVSGESHQVISGDLASSASQAGASASGLFSQALSVAQRGANVVGLRGVLAVLVQLVGGLVSRLLLRLPVIGIIAGTFVGFRKVLQPKYQQYIGGVEWERQRENEAYEKVELHLDDFVDADGAAQRYFARNRGRILASLAGENQHQQGTYDWYKEWEEWARQQWQQQQQDQSYSQRQQQSQQRTRAQRTSSPPEFQWDFDPNDPYSVLGIKRGATKSEVSAAYRKEMLKYHPDMQGKSTEAEKLRAAERAKLINDAYRKVKLGMK